jgi:hypothetical protein
MTDPAMTRVVYVEIWHPLRYIGRSGPRVFWREWLPRPTVTGVEWAKPSPWREMNKDAARKVFAMPNSYFTLAEYPGVTFCWRKFKTPTLADYHEAQALRAASPP